MTLLHHAKKAGYSQATFRAAIAAVSCTLALTACHSPEVSQATAANSASTASPANAPQLGTAPQGSPFAPNPAGAAARAAGADNYGKLLQRYPDAQKVKIKGWYASHAIHSMSFTSNAQWQWMQQHDYPTPDDVLLASRMTKAQLRDLAMHGDTKANFFYLARLLDDVAEAGGSSMLAGHKQTHVQAELTWSMDRALASGSAFAGYMFGNYYAALHGKAAAGVGMAAGLTWADSFGDSRAISNNQMAAMGFPGVSGVRAAEVYFDMFAAAARVNPYFLNARRGRGELFIPIQ